MHEGVISVLGVVTGTSTWELADQPKPKRGASSIKKLDGEAEEVAQ